MNKPPYKVPSMQEIADLPWNGYNVVSTFSGCGGSCLGFKMAGFKVLWANEFIPAAQDTYRANHKGTILDTRDIRKVQASEILEAVGLSKGQLDVFEGSPPCASFSTAGKREAGWGKVKKYSDSCQRTDDLFFEYARLLKDLQPKVFIAENVSGLVKGTAKGYFLLILKALKECGYNVSAKVLDAQWLGVPQARQRLIFIGVRNDLGIEPKHPKPLPYFYSVRDAIPWITKVSTLSYSNKPGEGRHTFHDASQIPAPTVKQSRGGNTEWSSEALVEAESDISRYAIGKEWDKLKPGQKSAKYLQLQKPSLNKACPTITVSGITEFGVGCAQVCHPLEKRKFSIAELKRICAFPDDFILTGSYAQQWERLGRAVPPVMACAIAKAIRDDILNKLNDN
jgi:DNA (cytosine-5)-methyltransferase 1